MIILKVRLHLFPWADICLAGTPNLAGLSRDQIMQAPPPLKWRLLIVSGWLN